MSITTEFPTYPLSSLPPIPSTWEDTSWHNDACPSYHTGNGVYVYVDFEEASEREYPESTERFSVVHIDNDITLYSGNDWEEVLRITK